MDRVLIWLESSFRRGSQLNGILYLHRVIDPKMQGSALQNARMFRQLCGPDCFKKIFLGTTFWENVQRASENRENTNSNEILTSGEQMVGKGSQVVRLENNKEDGLRVLEQIAMKEKIMLQSQKELVIEKKSHQETAAAKIMSKEILKQKQELERNLAEEQRRHQLEIERADHRRGEQAARERERLRREAKSGRGSVSWQKREIGKPSKKLNRQDWKRRGTVEPNFSVLKNESTELGENNKPNKQERGHKGR